MSASETTLTVVDEVSGDDDDPHVQAADKALDESRQTHTQAKKKLDQMEKDMKSKRDKEASTACAARLTRFPFIHATHFLRRRSN